MLEDLFDTTGLGELSAKKKRLHNFIRLFSEGAHMLSQKDMDLIIQWQLGSTSIDQGELNRSIKGIWTDAYEVIEEEEKRDEVLNNLDNAAREREFVGSKGVDFG